MMRRIVIEQRGSALVMAMAFVVLAVPLITGALGLASSLSVDARVKASVLKSHYSLLGGTEHAAYRLFYEPGYMEGLIVGEPDTYSLALNGKSVAVSVLKPNASESEDSSTPPPSDGSRKLRTTKEVSVTVAEPNLLTLVTYTISVENADNTSHRLNKVHDLLPDGFGYIPGSTKGITTQDPSSSGQTLTWDVASQKIELQPGETVTLSFDAQAIVPEGNYCNEAWVDPGGANTTSGKTAMVTVGSPPDSTCQQPSASLGKTVLPNVAPANTPQTYTYTISIENTGPSALHLTRVRDLLPEGGFSYVSGSTSGDLTTADPQVLSGSRERLTWSFAPSQHIQSGETRTLVFQAEATLDVGEYWNEAWVTTEELGELYSWRIAPVKIVPWFEVTVRDGESKSIATVWVDAASYQIASWEFVRERN